MRGNDDQLQSGMFSYVSLEDRIPEAHPLRGVRKLADAVLAEMSKDFDGMYAKVGRPSIPPERLFRALLLQVFYSVRSERLLMEQLDYNLLFRWFVGLEIDEPVWNHAVFSKNRDRLSATPGCSCWMKFASGAAGASPWERTRRTTRKILSLQSESCGSRRMSRRTRRTAEARLTVGRRTIPVMKSA
jgi:hypothetical protein